MSKIKVIFLSFLCMLIFSTYANARFVTLQWDTNDDADYYVVYWGEVSGNYIYNSNNIDAPATGYTTAYLEEKTWYFAVKAFNSYGNSSDFSDEIISSSGEADTHDSDGDGLSDALENEIGTSPFKTDTDGDGTKDGDEYLNYYVDNDGKVIIPDTDGDGTNDIADLDDDNDGIPNITENEAGTNPYYSEKMNHVDTIYITENGDPTIVILKTITSSKHPVCEIINRTENYTRLIEFGHDNYWATKILYNFGNLDNEGGNEIAVLMQNRSTGEMLEEIRDIQTGEIYTFPTSDTETETDTDDDSGTTTDPEPDTGDDSGDITDPEPDTGDNSGTTTDPDPDAGDDSGTTTDPEPDTTPTTLCKINAIKHRYFKTGTEIAEVGFCEETQRTIVRLYSVSDGKRTFVSDTIIPGVGIRPLNMVLIDTDNDGIEEIIVIPQNGGDDTIAKVTGFTITVQ